MGMGGKIAVLHWTRSMVKSGPGLHMAEVKGMWIPKGQNVKCAPEVSPGWLWGRILGWRERNRDAATKLESHWLFL